MIPWRVKRENYQVCSVQYYVQQLCTVQCTHTWTDLMVICWLDLTFLWLYFVLHFICVRLSFLRLFCVRDYMYVCFCSVIFSFFITMPRRMSPKWRILCWVERKTLTQSVWNLETGDAKNLAFCSILIEMIDFDAGWATLRSLIFSLLVYMIVSLECFDAVGCKNRLMRCCRGYQSSVASRLLYFSGAGLARFCCLQIA